MEDLKNEYDLYSAFHRDENISLKQFLEDGIYEDDELNDHGVNLSTNKSKKSILAILLIFVIIGLSVYIYYTDTMYKNQINEIKYSCTPLASQSELTQLNIESDTVKKLYSIISTNIEEDLADNQLDEQMKFFN